MAYLEMADAVLAPDLGDQFKVERRLETRTQRGRSLQTPSVFTNLSGVITMASPNDLLRLPDTERMDRHISVVTNFALRGPTTDYQPDIIWWRGDSYVVKTFEPYPQFGSGFYQAICGSVDATDQAI